jgi:hypothetical protein
MFLGRNPFVVPNCEAALCGSATDWHKAIMRQTWYSDAAFILQQSGIFIIPTIYFAIRSTSSFVQINKTVDIRITRNNEARSCNECCSGKAINITFTCSEFVSVASFPGYKGHTPSSVPFPTLPNISTLSHKRHCFRGRGGGYWKWNVSFDFLYKFFNISHSESNSARHYHKCTHVFMLSALYSFPVLMKLDISRHFRKIAEYNISLKSFQSEPSRSIWTDRRTEMKLMVSFSQICDLA